MISELFSIEDAVSIALRPFKQVPTEPPVDYAATCYLLYLFCKELQKNKFNLLIGDHPDVVKFHDLLEQYKDTLKAEFSAK